MPLTARRLRLNVTDCDALEGLLEMREALETRPFETIPVGRRLCCEAEDSISHRSDVLAVGLPEARGKLLPL